MIDLTALSDDDLATLRTNVAIELERRQNREAIPATIADLAKTYRDAGGDPADLHTAISD